MPFTHTLAEAKTSALKNVAGLCVDSQDFIDTVNEAQRRLAKRGNWFDTEWLIRVCIHSPCITWPRFVGTVRGVRFVNYNGSGEADMRNRWFSIIGSGMSCCGAFSSNVVIQDANTSPCVNEVASDTGSNLRYYVVKRNDLGKTIRIHGREYGGQPLQEKDANGAWVDGITLTSAAPYVQSTRLVARNGISSVVRQETEGMAYLYEYDPITGLMRDLGAYEPGETHPRYRRSMIHNYASIYGTQDDNGQWTKSVEALVKLAFIPVKTDNDFLFIDDFDALKFMVQAIKAEEANDDKLAEVKILKSIREMNFTDRDKSPGEQTSVRVDSNYGRISRNPR